MDKAKAKRCEHTPAIGKIGFARKWREKRGSLGYAAQHQGACLTVSANTIIRGKVYVSAKALSLFLHEPQRLPRKVAEQAVKIAMGLCYSRFSD